MIADRIIAVTFTTTPMKPIPTNNLTFENAFKIPCTDEDTQLWRIGLDQYAVTVDWQEEPIFAFKSKKFSKIISSIGFEPVGLSVTKCTSLSSQNQNDSIEIRVQSSSGLNYHFNSNQVSTSFNLKKSKLSYKDSFAHLTPMKLWNLPNRYPYSHMLLTDAFANSIGQFIHDDNAGEIMTHLWTSFKRSTTGSLTDSIADVDCEFCTFSIAGLFCGRFAFMTLDEA